MKSPIRVSIRETKWIKWIPDPLGFDPADQGSPNDKQN